MRFNFKYPIMFAIWSIVFLVSGFLIMYFSHTLDKMVGSLPIFFICSGFFTWWVYYKRKIFHCVKCNSDVKANSYGNMPTFHKKGKCLK